MKIGLFKRVLVYVSIVSFILSCEKDTDSSNSTKPTPNIGANSTAIVGLSTTLQSETIAFAQAHGAAGSNADARSLGVLDRFIVGAKKAGIYTKLKDFMPFQGSNLAGAVLKVIGPTATAVNFVEADFTLTGGLDSGTGGATNSTKYVDENVDAPSLGVTYNNISAFVGLASGGLGARYQANGTYQFGALIANYDAASNSTVILNQNGASGINNVTVSFPLSFLSGFSSTSSGISFFRNGVQHLLPAAISTTTPIVGNFNLFRARAGGANQFMSERIGISIIATGLTDVEAKILTNLMMTYLREMGRIPNKPNFVGFGDSITQGTGSGNANIGSWSAQLSKKLEFNNLNVGVGSSQLRQSASPIYGGFARYQELYELPIDLLAIMYGTNDIGLADLTTNGDATLISDAASKLNTILTNVTQRNIRTFVLSPPWRADANATKLSAWVKALSDVTVTQGIPFVDNYNIFLDTGNPSNFFPDLLHPNDAGHSLIAQHAMAALQGRIYRDALLDFPSIAAGSSTTLTVTMYSARAGQPINVTLPASIATLGLTYSYWFSANDTVTIQLNNPTGAAIDPPAANYKTVVWFN